VQIWLRPNKVCRNLYRSLCEKQKKLSCWLEFLKHSLNLFYFLCGHSSSFERSRLFTWILAEAIYFSLLQNVQTGCTVHPTMTAHLHLMTQLRMSEDIIPPSRMRYDIERILPFFNVTCNYNDIYLVYWLKAHYIHTICKNVS
jgi:hypothetical protein